jgi:hypothetical protein
LSLGLTTSLGEVSEKNPFENVSNTDGSTMKFFSPTEALYTFLSPLHMRYVQWMLLGNLDNGVISENSIVDFILAVICKFIPFNQSARRTFGATTQSTPEAQF